MGLLRSGIGKVGWAPTARKASLLMFGCEGSFRKGPGPLWGAIKTGAKATQPTLPFGANCGISDWGAAAPAAQQTAEISPAIIPRGKANRCIPQAPPDPPISLTGTNVPEHAVSGC